MGMFGGNGCGGNDNSWIWVVLIVVFVLCVCGDGNILGSGSNGCCENPCCQKIGSITIWLYSLETQNIQLNRCSHFAGNHFQIAKTPYFKGFSNFWSYSHSNITFVLTVN